VGRCRPEQPGGNQWESIHQAMQCQAGCAARCRRLMWLQQAPSQQPQRTDCLPSGLPIRRGDEGEVVGRLGLAAILAQGVHCHHVLQQGVVGKGRGIMRGGASTRVLLWPALPCTALHCPALPCTTQRARTDRLASLQQARSHMGIRQVPTCVAGVKSLKLATGLLVVTTTGALPLRGVAVKVYCSSGQKHR